ncbi:hypothetical protein BpHYR1_053753 [Brachionus plicatilis]|uniref:Uncharacterized protein n=1 Tax=Brachionus plicatilis TaxID=10195 RepID=A0A3M7PNZ6_BRAPC|nr:hypothetical protein BpHYR1_053753 [Brachionus plicatilis]
MIHKINFNKIIRNSGEIKINKKNSHQLIFCIGDFDYDVTLLLTDGRDTFSTQELLNVHAN